MYSCAGWSLHKVPCRGVRGSEVPLLLCASPVMVIFLFHHPLCIC